MFTFLKLIRWPNVVMTILTQLVIVYAILNPSGVDLALDWWQLTLLILSTALLTAGGNVINDIQDVEIDKVNKPEKVLVGKVISENNAFTIYAVLTVIAVIAGFVLSNSLDKPIMATVFVFIAFVLYIYATTLKSILLLGNLLISILVGLVIMITGVFELYPVITPVNQGAQQVMLKILFDFAIGAFLINLAREWVKDCEDINGDHSGGRNTLAIAIGRIRAARVVSIFLLGVIALFVWYIYNYLYQNQIALFYFVFIIIAPLMYVMLRLWSSEKTAQFTLLSMILKIVLFAGICSMAVISLTV
ncbi:geranylgeranylglycerol-phosphate geranylgeranyltransferase [Nonlabens ulvanivorans]|uniref:geranylgeranylglycerol-phosphate geranylgeranyltransferase n=1 Tax=Nonlabens ulvanivorans TaxID=906888 RepID=UPI002943C9A5|nr:geranylgeranylglycerol-phosphate geranylgeranyltransferase [Nonlabens ulvanivorans]WOI23705.1 geranylgeranylglycerol-phosphate geranylgeranyltransferase [Nonlabens ulvanivorans]